MKGKGSESSIMVICKPFAYAVNPLGRRLPELGEMPMTFLYGQYDWMGSETAEELIEARKVNATCHRVNNAGHHLYVENPEDCVAYILNNCNLA